MLTTRGNCHSALLLGLVLISSLGSANALDDLQRFFTQIKTFEAEFDQVILDEDFVTLEESSGRVAIVRPNKFRWDYAAPLEQQIIGDGAKVWIYDIDLEQVTVRNMAAAMGNTPAVLLAGRGELEETYDIRDLGVQGTLNWVRLSPKQSDDSSFDDIRLGFDHSKLRVLELVDGFGQTTRITLRRMVENPAINDQTFEFTPPAGVDVIAEDEL
ncbi:MAG: outer membrane lipoprotein chaperone LolA [Gammaproteobacteria bacterium]|nr:outer membrane lipoprotein chaperone LolA [Gammaproteobacteria bacterium]MDH3465553.1 outer membrane lipoprotein chaperone LolA [Gammaproteobacteria bacterium]